MDFSSDKAIYVQMAGRLCDDIIAGTYKANDRIPSVREYAVTLEVNTNTVAKAFDLLSRNEIIYQKRGMGFFVSEGAREQILLERKKEFIESTIPQVFREMRLLDIDIKDVDKLWKEQNT